MTELLLSGVGSFLPSSEGTAANPLVSTTTPATSFSSVLHKAIGGVQRSRIAKTTPPLSSVFPLLFPVFEAHSIATPRVAMDSATTSMAMEENNDTKKNSAALLPFQEEQSVDTMAADTVAIESTPLVSILITLPPKTPNPVVLDAVMSNTPKNELQLLQGAVDNLVRVVTDLYRQGQTTPVGDATETPTGIIGTTREGVVGIASTGDGIETKERANNGVIPKVQPEDSKDTGEQGENGVLSQLTPRQERIQEEGILNDEQQKSGSSESGKRVPRQSTEKILISDEPISAEGKHNPPTTVIPKVQQRVSHTRIAQSDEKIVGEQPLVQKGQNREQPNKGVTQSGSILQQIAIEQSLPLAGETPTVQAHSPTTVDSIPVVGLVEAVLHGTQEGRVPQPDRGIERNLVVQEERKPQQMFAEKSLHVAAKTPVVPTYSNAVVVDIPMIGSVELVLHSTGEGSTHVDIAIPQRVPGTPETFTALINVLSQKIAENPVFPQRGMADRDSAKGAPIVQDSMVVPLKNQTQEGSLSGEVTNEMVTQQEATDFAVAYRKSDSGLSYKSGTVLPQQEGTQGQPSLVIEQKGRTGDEHSQKVTNIPMHGEDKAVSLMSKQEPSKENGELQGEVLHEVQTKPHRAAEADTLVQPHSSPVVAVDGQPHRPLSATRNVSPLVVGSLRFAFIQTHNADTVQDSVAESPDKERQFAGIASVKYPIDGTTMPGQLYSDTTVPDEVVPDEAGIRTTAPMAKRDNSVYNTRDLVQNVQQPASFREKLTDLSQKTSVSSLHALAGERSVSVESINASVPTISGRGEVRAKDNGESMAAPTFVINAANEEIAIPSHKVENSAHDSHTITVHTNGDGANPDEIDVPMPTVNRKKSVAEHDSAQGLLLTQEQVKEISASNWSTIAEGVESLDTPIQYTATTLPIETRSTTIEEMFLPPRPSEKELPNEQKTPDVPVEPEVQPDTKARVEPHPTEFVPEYDSGVLEGAKEDGVSLPKTTNSLDETDTVEGELIPLLHKEEQTLSPVYGVPKQEPARMVETALPRARTLAQDGVVTVSKEVKISGSGQEPRGGERILPIVPQVIQDQPHAQELSEPAPTITAAPREKAQGVDASTDGGHATPIAPTPISAGIAALDAVFRDIESRGGFSAHIDVPVVTKNGEPLAQIQVNNSQTYSNRQEHTLIQSDVQRKPIDSVMRENVSTEPRPVPHEPLFHADGLSTEDKPLSSGIMEKTFGNIPNHEEVGTAIEERKQQVVASPTKHSATEYGENTVVSSDGRKQQEFEVAAKEPQLHDGQKVSTEYSMRREDAVRPTTSAPVGVKPLLAANEDVAVGGPVLLQQEKVFDERTPFIAERYRESDVVAREQKQAAPFLSPTTIDVPARNNGGNSVLAQTSTGEHVAAPAVPKVEVPKKGDVEKPVVARVPAEEGIAVASSPTIDVPRKTDVVQPVRAAAEHILVPTGQPKEAGVPVRDTSGKTERAEALQPSSSVTLARSAVAAMNTASTAMPVRTTAGKLSASRGREPWQDMAMKEQALDDVVSREFPLAETRARFPLHGLRDIPELVYRDTVGHDKAVEKSSLHEDVQGAKVGGSNDGQQSSANDNGNAGQHENKSMRPDIVPMRSAVPHQAKPAPSFMRSFSNVVPNDIPQIVQSVMRTVPSGTGGIVQMTLMPEALGEVVVALSVLHGVADVVIDTENGESKRAVEAQLPVLRERLAHAGLQVEHVEVRTKQHESVQGDAARSGRQGGQMQEEQKSRQEFLRSFRHLASYEPVDMPDARTVPPTPRQSHSGYFERYA